MLPLPKALFKIACECGSSVYPVSLEEHKKSRSHVEAMMRMNLLERRGGENGLYQCECGMYVSHKQAPVHCTGKKHDHYIGTRIRGGKKCPECELYYSSSYQIHLMDDEHFLNIERRALYVYQRQMATVNLTEQKEMVHETFAQKNIELLDEITHTVNEKTKKEKIEPLYEHIKKGKAEIQAKENEYAEFLGNLKELDSTFCSSESKSQSIIEYYYEVRILVLIKRKEDQRDYLKKDFYQLLT